MALLDHVGHRQAVVAEPRCDGYDEAHMSAGELMQRDLVLGVLPALGKRQLFLATEKRRVHGRLDEAAPQTQGVRHEVNSDGRFDPGPHRVEAMSRPAPETRAGKERERWRFFNLS